MHGTIRNLSFRCRLLNLKVRLRSLTPHGTLLWRRVDPQAQRAHTQPAGDHQQVDAVEQRHGTWRVAQDRERQRAERGRDVILELAGRGDVIGEAALSDDGGRGVILSPGCVIRHPVDHALLAEVVGDITKGTR